MTNDDERQPTADAGPAATTRVTSIADEDPAAPRPKDHGPRAATGSARSHDTDAGSSADPETKRKIPTRRYNKQGNDFVAGRESSLNIPGLSQAPLEDLDQAGIATEVGRLGAKQRDAGPKRDDDRADSRLLTDRDDQLARQEHLATIGRLSRLLPLAIVLWLGFFFVDFVLATWVVPGPLLPYFGLRMIGVVPIVAVWWRLKRKPPPRPSQLAVLDVIMTSSSAGVLATMCLLSGGLTSPFSTYIAMVIAGRAAVWPNPWRTGALRLGVAAVASPVVIAIALPFSPTLRAQLSDPTALATYFFFLMLIFGAWILLVIGSHNAWTLRRQVFRSRSIGRYRLDKRIGRGGMGEVWIAWHDQLQRKVALKILRPDAGTEASAVARFEREIMSTAALSHPNTVRIYDHGVTDDGLWYYAMELLQGEDLQRLVARDGPLPCRRAVALTRQAAGALAEAHRAKIVHRDVKPENLFVAELGGEVDVVKVLDFGIARVTKSGGDTRLTGTGWVAGTPAYLSPEAAGGFDVEAPGDVYGLGAVLYFALTATTPFSANNSMQLLRLHVSAPVEPPSKRLGAKIPAELEALVMCCLAKAPEDRYADAGALAVALDRLSWADEGAGEPSEGPDGDPPRITAPRYSP